MLQFERDPIMKTIDTPDQDLPTIRFRTMQKIVLQILTKGRMGQYLSSESLTDFRARMDMLTMFDPASWTRIGVHYGLFFGAISGQATPEQLGYWVGKGALSLNGVIGCFAMTEVEFIIHTPTLTATKWWIGGAAQTATHSAVYAQLIINGKHHGVKTFVVQLRDPKTFILLPGVVIGDCGAKMGRHGIDNGWIQFTKVLRTGRLIEPPLAQLAFGALIGGRVSMITDSGNIAKKALTIAIRYAAVRRQFGNTDGVETKLLDYVIHQRRLMPLLAQAFAMHFTGKEVSAMNDVLTSRLGGLTKDSTDTAEVLDALKELHGTSAGLKAFCTWNALDTIDQCRQSLGGHGYSAYAGLATLYADFAVQCSWEGDNTILTLQAGRYLIGCYREAKKGKKMASGVAYLNDIEGLVKTKCSATSPDEIGLETIGMGFWVVSGNLVQKAGNDFEACLKKGKKEEEAYEECSSARLAAAKMHSFGYLFHRFKDGISKAPKALYPILKMDWIRDLVTSLCRTIRGSAVSLTDAFNFSDFIINSPLGRYDGNIYETYFGVVNDAHKPAVIPPYFQSTIYPILNRVREDDDVLELDDEE